MFKEFMKPDILKKVGIVSGAIASFASQQHFYTVFLRNSNNGYVTPNLIN